MERHSSTTSIDSNNSIDVSNPDVGRQKEVVPLKEAAVLLDLTTSKLKRMIKVGELPEAVKTRTPEGRIWAIPVQSLPDIAARQQVELSGNDDSEAFEIISVDEEGRVTIRSDDPPAPPEIDLVAEEGAPSFVEALDLALLDRLLGVQEQAVLAVADAERAEADVETLSLRQKEIDADLAAERERRLALEERFHAEQLARVTAESRAAELEARVRREEALAREERAAASYANMRSLRRERETALATANLGWRARRRYFRQLSLETPT